MKNFLAGIVSLLCVASAWAATPRADPDYLATIRDDEPAPLPRGLAPHERGLWAPLTVPPLTDTVRAAPTGAVRAQAEYEANHGILIRWGAYNALHTAMVVPITRANPPADVWVVVSDASQEATARQVLSGGGADLAHVHFVIARTDSVWIRDYGPRFIDDGGRRGIVDHIYNRPRANDDAFPPVFGARLNETVYDMPLSHGGGNFHLFRNRDAFMTRLVVNENPGLSEPQIKAMYRDYQGLNLTLTDPFPSTYDSTQHIDMWMLPLADNRVLIGQYAASEGAGVPKNVTDSAAALMASRGYTVYRTPGWRANGAHYTYTNAVIVNQLVLTCRFNGYDTQNAQALATFQAALPDHEIIQVDCTQIIGLAGAIHCIVMHMPDLLWRNAFDIED